MTKKVYLFAAAAAAAVGAYAGGVEPVDWSSFAPGSTYTVPADTTNEVAAADYDISCVIGSDAHKPEDVRGNMPEVFAMADRLGIKCINHLVAQSIINSQAK